MRPKLARLRRGDPRRASARPTSSTAAARTRCCSSCSPIAGIGTMVTPMSVEELQALEARYAMRHLRAGAGRVRARRGRAAVGLRRARVPRLLRRALGPQRGPLPPADRRRDHRAGGGCAGSSNLFYSEPAMRLCERLAESSLGGRVFLCNSGAEASECAIKLVRKRAHARGHRGARDRHPRRRLSRPHARGARGDAEARPRRPLRAAAARLRRGPARRPRGAARGGRRADGRGDDRADPGRGGHLPDRRRGPGRRARGVRRGRRGARLRRGPVRDGEDRDACGPTSSSACGPTC